MGEMESIAALEPTKETTFGELRDGEVFYIERNAAEFRLTAYRKMCGSLYYPVKRDGHVYRKLDSARVWIRFDE